MEPHRLETTVGPAEQYYIEYAISQRHAEVIREGIRLGLEQEVRTVRPGHGLLAMVFAAVGAIGALGRNRRLHPGVAAAATPPVDSSALPTVLSSSAPVR